MTMHMKPESPAELLRIADGCMRSLQPAQRTTFHRDGWLYRVRWDYPGVLMVFRALDGVLVARSLAGRPTVPAKASGRRV
jgi:hypothetical protein